MTIKTMTLCRCLEKNQNGCENIRAAGGKASVKRGRSKPVQLTEISLGERAPILKAWAKVATSDRKHLPVSEDAPISVFEAIAGDYPVFRIEHTGYT